MLYKYIYIYIYIYRGPGSSLDDLQQLYISATIHHSEPIFPSYIHMPAPEYMYSDSRPLPHSRPCVVNRHRQLVMTSSGNVRTMELLLQANKRSPYQ